MFIQEKHRRTIGEDWKARCLNAYILFILMTNGTIEDLDYNLKTKLQ